MRRLSPASAFIKRTKNPKAALASLPFTHQALLRHHWPFWARPDQLAPPGPWSIWLFMGGRGAGKTRAGAEWVKMKVARGARRIALIGPAFRDVRDVMIEGPSGLIAISDPGARPSYEASRRRLVWPCGAVAAGYSSEDPDGLRGPQFDLAWGDEFAAWTYAQETLDMVRLGLRLGRHPQMMLTTTPRAHPALRALIKAPGVVMTRASTRDNAAHLSAGFVEALEASFGASALARQELDGILIEDPDDALWTRAEVDGALKRGAFTPERLVIGVDPPASGGPNSDECGIIAAGCDGMGQTRRFIVLGDHSLQGRAEVWARAVVEAFHSHAADKVIAEANQGGDMVRAVLRQVDPDLPIRLVHASRAKRARAEPIAALYAQGRVHHAARFCDLEDQMCTFGSDQMTQRSPDRVDALVWALSHLAGKAIAPRFRQL